MPQVRGSIVAKKVLLLCAGPDMRESSLLNLLRKAGVDGENWDLANGPQYDIADDANWDPLLARVRAKEFAAAFASPPCTTASRLRNRPGGPPPLRGITGPDRYGLKGLTVPNKELVRLHNLILVRVAEVLQIMVDHESPWVFETPALRDGEVSVLRLDEYQNLMSNSAVEHVIGVQCPFGAISTKPTSWVSHRVSMSDMPQECQHAKRPWFNDRTGTAVVASHRPTAGTDTYSLTQKVASATGVFVSPNFVSASLAAYPDLLNRFLVSKLIKALGDVPARPFRPSAVMLAVSPRKFAETVEWRQRLRGVVDIDDKTKADNLAIGGLRNAAESLSRLHTVQAFGIALGNEIRTLLRDNFSKSPTDGSWIDLTCKLIGSTDKDVRPPADAIAAVKAIMVKHIGGDAAVAQGALTRINSTLPGRWRKIAGHPDDRVELLFER